MPRRKADEEAVLQYELAGFPAGAAKHEFTNIGDLLALVAEALAAQVREYGQTPFLSVATRMTALATDAAQRGYAAADRWQRADQERTGYPEKYRRK